MNILHVPIQLATGQHSVTNTARDLLRLLPRVSPHVFLQLRAGDGAEPALLTNVRTLAAMNSQVNVQVAHVGEHRPTLLAQVGLHTRVGPHVAAESTGLHEGQVTVLTLVGSFPRMEADVGAKRTQLVERPPTLVADVGPPVVVEVQHVLLQAVVAGEGCRADFTRERSLARVLVSVQLKQPAFEESVSA